MLEMIKNIWKSFLELPVEWQLFICTTIIFEAIKKLASWIASKIPTLWKSLQRKIFYKFHKISVHQFTGTLKRKDHNENKSIFWFCEQNKEYIKKVENCISMKHMGLFKKCYEFTENGINNNPDQIDKRWELFDNLSFIEKMKLHKIYVELYRDYENRNNEPTFEDLDFLNRPSKYL